MDSARSLGQENAVDETEEDQNDLRYGGNHLRVVDPNAPPYSPFYLMVTGHLQSGTMNEKDGVSASFNFVADSQWQKHSVSQLHSLHRKVVC